MFFIWAWDANMTHILARVISRASKICPSSLTVNVCYVPELDPPSLVHCLQWVGLIQEHNIHSVPTF